MSTAPLANPPDLLELERVSVAFPGRRGVSFAVRRVSLSVADGEVLGIVGESGSGKSMTCRAIVNLIPDPGEVVGGSIRFAGTDLNSGRAAAWRRVRGRDIGIVFQDPRHSVDPLQSVGGQLTEVLRIVAGQRRNAARAHAVEALAAVGIPEPDVRYRAYPHQLSGGMLQRVAIALAVAPKPRLLLADEPTSALDVTVQAQVLDLLLSLQASRGMAMILVSHDFGVIAKTAHTVAVMYAGYVVEYGPVAAVLAAPRHPYTAALIASLIPLGQPARKQRIHAIAGQLPPSGEVPPGCPFQARCPHATLSCREVNMELLEPVARHKTACPFVGQEAVAP